MLGATGGGGRGREVEGGMMRRRRGSLRDNEAAVVTCEGSEHAQVRNALQFGCKTFKLMCSET